MATSFDLLPSAQSESDLSRGMFSIEGVTFTARPQQRQRIQNEIQLMLFLFKSLIFISILINYYSTLRAKVIFFFNFY